MPAALQIIDETQVFSEANFAQILRDPGDTVLRVVSILGPQSSGKSTLLNGLFDSSFTVMDRLNRQQTTRGIWASYSLKDSTLILDVEGTDGRERGEDQDFERKSALFSLAVSDILIINVWENAVGLYHAANMSLLRTVMEVHRHLVSDRSHPTILLFVIRDFAGVTPRENIRSVLMGDLERLWSSICVPQGGVLSLESSFDVQFEFLPHKLLQRAEFDEELDRLKQKFKCTEFSLLGAEERLIPSEDFIEFASSIWEKILASKDLHLPTERELVAQYRCEAILNEILHDQSRELEPLRQSIATGSAISGLGHRLDEIFEATKISFRNRSQRYPTKITQQKLEELRSESIEDFSKLIKSQVFSLFGEMKSLFTEEVTLSSKLSFRARLEKASAYWITKVNAAIRDATPEVAANLGEELLVELESLHSDLITSVKSQEAERLSNVLFKRVDELHKKFTKAIVMPKTEFHEAFSFLIKDSDRIFEEFNDALLEDLRLNTDGLIRVRARAGEELCKQLTDLLKHTFGLTQLIEQLTQKFESKFSYDETGLPRVWTDEIEVEKIFREARQSIFDELDLVQNLPVVEIMQPTIFSSLSESLAASLPEPTAISNCKSSMEKYFHRRFLEAKRSAVTSQTKIPLWIFILLLALGWNEIMAVLSSPIRILLLALVSGLAYLVTALNLLPYIKRWVYTFALPSTITSAIAHTKSD